MYRSYDDEQSAIQAAVATFPATFTLRAYLNNQARLSPYKSHFFSGDSMQLVVQILGDDGIWRDLSRGTPEELRREIVR